MGTPLNKSGRGIPLRTARTIARANGAKVPELPATNGYCPSHGTDHAGGSCNKMAPDAEAEDVSRSGGSARMSATKPPFTVKGA